MGIAAALPAGVLTRSEARSMRPVTSPDMGDSGGSPWRRPKLALREGESLVFCESLLLGVILQPPHPCQPLLHWGKQTLHSWMYPSPPASADSNKAACRLTVRNLLGTEHA